MPGKSGSAIKDLERRVHCLEEEMRQIRGQDLVPVTREDGEIGYEPRDVVIIGDLMKKAVPEPMDGGINAYIIHAGRLACKGGTSEWVNTSGWGVIETPVEKVTSFVSPFTSEQRIGIMKSLFLVEERGKGKTASQLRKETGLDSGPLYHHLKDLVSAKYVRKRKRGRYELSVKGHVALLTISHMASCLDEFEKETKKARG